MEQLMRESLSGYFHGPGRITFFQMGIMGGMFKYDCPEVLMEFHCEDLQEY